MVEKEVGHKIHTNTRKRSYTYARAVYCKVAREMNEAKPYSLSEIGDVINRDHATVLHSLNTVFPFAMQEPSFKFMYLTLRAIFVDAKEDIEEAFNEAEALRDVIIKVEKNNASLKNRLDDLKSSSIKFNSLVDGLSKEELDEVYERLDLIVRSIKSRVYN